MSPGDAANILQHEDQSLHFKDGDGKDKSLRLGGEDGTYFAIAVTGSP